MIVNINMRQFQKTMNNIVEYSNGFLDGIQKGKKVFLNNLGLATVEAMAHYVDINAKGNPDALHHVYEWYQTGSPDARLFDIKYTVSNLGLSFDANFKQSRTIKEGSNQPFYNKASIMENGIPVTITPKKTALVFDVQGREVFTRKPVTVRNPGGLEVNNSFERTIDEFILRYFKQSFLRASGLYNYIQRPTLYKKEIKSGAKLGKNKGISVGYRWIANAKVGVE